MQKLLIILQLLFLFCVTSCAKSGIDRDVDEPEVSYYASIYAEIDGIGAYRGRSAQGFAVFENVGFCFYDAGYCQSVDLKEKQMMSSFVLPKGVAHPNNHCGVACFSNEFFAPDDKFPLLYLSSYKEFKCYVLRMTETDAEVVQIIQMKDEAGNVIPVYAFMPDGDEMIMKMNYPAKVDNEYTYEWKVTTRPKIDEMLKTLLSDNIERSFSVKSSDLYNAGFCRNNIIYQLAGYGGKGSKKMYIIDSHSGTILKELVWEEDFLYNEEHEQCSPFGNNGILINYNGADYISYVQLTGWII